MNLKVVSCVDNPLLWVCIHHTQNIIHWDNDVLCDLIPGTGSSDPPQET